MIQPGKILEFTVSALNTIIKKTVTLYNISHTVMFNEYEALRC